MALIHKDIHARLGALACHWPESNWQERGKNIHVYLCVLVPQLCRRPISGEQFFQHVAHFKFV